MVDSEPMQVITLPGMFLPNNEGAPNLPGTGRFIAIPQGATAEVTVLSSRTEVYHDMNLAPAPPIPLETDDSPPTYWKDPSIYTVDAYYPTEPVKPSEPMKLRGVDVVILGITVVLVTIVAWFYALIAGRYPRGLFDYVVGVIRWGARVNAYFLSLTDEYPPFNLSATAGPAGGDSYLISSIIGFLLTGGIIAGGVVLAITLPEELEVGVDYAGLQAERPARLVGIADVWVSLLSVSDPLSEEETLLEPERGNRLVGFQFSLLNDKGRDVKIRESDFKLRDEDGDKHDPELVMVAGHPAPEEVEEGERATVQVIFELPSEVEPTRLDFSPGFAPLKTVKYVFE